MKKLSLILLSALMVAACGEKSNSENPPVTVVPPVDNIENIPLVNPNGFTEEQIRSDWELPPTPDENDPDYNTIKGVVYTGELTNGQTARSDWIITNAIATYPDKREFDILNKGAVNNNQMIEAYESGDDTKLKELFDEYIWGLACHGYYYYDDDTNVNLFNSIARDTNIRNKYQEDIGYKIDALLDGPITLPTDAEAEEECPKFISE